MCSKRHLRCPHCGFLDTIKRGKRAGYSRYSCKSCGSYFTDRRASVSRKNKEVWFREWIVGKRTFSQLVCDSPYSERTLKRYFYEMLPRCPVWHIQRREQVNLLIDGTYFPNKVCLVLYRDASIRMTLFYRLTDGEHFPDIAREIESWITRKPKSEAARELLLLVRLLNCIHTQKQAQLWIRAFIDWHKKYQTFIDEKTSDEQTGRWWFTHKMLHRSASHIKRAIPEMFAYTRYPKVPKSSNSIEAFFGHLKDNLSIHRGLSKEQFKDFIKWYLFFKSNETKIKKKE